MNKGLKVILWIASIVVGTGAILNLTVFEVWTVQSDDPVLSTSIEPTLRPGDVLLVSRSGGAHRGYLMRCADPRASGRFVLGRAFGFPPEELSVTNGLVLLDGKRNPSPRTCVNKSVYDPTLNEQTELGCAVEEVSQHTFEILRDPKNKSVEYKKRVEDNRVFLISDNRAFHDDSRDYGDLDPNLCHHVLFRLWSAGGFSDDKHRFNIIW